MGESKNTILTQEDLSFILQKLTELNERMPNLSDLTKEDKKALNKIGESSVTFINNALEIITHNNKFLPKSFNDAEFKQDVETFSVLGKIISQYQILFEKMVDTHMIFADSCYKKALDIYKYAKLDNSDGKHKVIITTMSKHFNKQGKKAEDTSKDANKDATNTKDTKKAKDKANVKEADDKQI